MEVQGMPMPLTVLLLATRMRQVLLPPLRLEEEQFKTVPIREDIIHMSDRTTLDFDGTILTRT